MPLLDDEELPIGKIAESATRAYAAACAGLEIEPMAPVSETWRRVCEVLAGNDATFTIKELGRHVRMLYLSCSELPPDEIDVPAGPKAAIAWEAVGLHLFNMIQGTDDNPRNLEASWATWARERLTAAEKETS